MSINIDVAIFKENSDDHDYRQIRINGMEVVGIYQEGQMPCPKLIVWNEDGEVIFAMEVAPGNFTVVEP